eukprot:PhM_4_TR3472/c1_g1_i1/m.77863
MANISPQQPLVRIDTTSLSTPVITGYPNNINNNINNTNNNINNTANTHHHTNSNTNSNNNSNSSTPSNSNSNSNSSLHNHNHAIVRRASKPTSPTSPSPLVPKSETQATDMMLIINSRTSNIPPNLFSNSNNSNSNRTQASAFQQFESLKDPRLSLPFPFWLSIILSVVILVSFLALFFTLKHYETQAMEHIGTSYISEVQVSLQREVSAFLENARRICRSYAGRLSFDNTSWQSWEFHRRQIYELGYSDGIAEVSGIYFGDVFSRFYYTSPDVQWFRWQALTPAVLSFEPVVSGCDAGLLEMPMPINEVVVSASSREQTRCHLPNGAYNATKRPWFLDAHAIADRGARLGRAVSETSRLVAWSELYAFANSSQLGTTVATPVFVNDVFVGVVAVDVVGTNIMLALQRHDAPDDTEIFIVDETNQLVATRNPNVKMVMSDDNGEATPVSVYDSLHGELFKYLENDELEVAQRHVVSGTPFFHVSSQDAAAIRAPATSNDKGIYRLRRCARVFLPQIP